MSTNYESLVTNLRDAADAAAGALRPDNEVSDLHQAVTHLRTVVDMLNDVDVEKPEAPTPNAVLSSASAIADDVHFHAIDLTGNGATELEELSTAIEATIAAGFRGDAPDLAWYNGDVPTDGSSWD